MANRDNHYEAAFEEFLRSRHAPYVAVDEGRRSLLADASIKSLDFIVSSSRGVTWLVDVKGRRFPGGVQKQYWKNWSTRDDLVSMAHLGAHLRRALSGDVRVRVQRAGSRSPLPREELFEHRNGLYAFVGIRLEAYAYHARQISPRWDTVAMPAERFRELAEPFERLL